MALPVAHPFAIKGDTNLALSSWRYDGASDQNTDRGRVWVELAEAGGGQVQVSLYRDEDLSLLVARGTGAPGGRVTLDPQNESLLEVSVVVETTWVPTQGIVLFLALATDLDLRERDDRIRGLLLEDEGDFSSVVKTTMRTFLTMMSRRFPPAPGVGDPLAYGEPTRSATRVSGEPELYAEALWSLRGGTWELTGLQNPEDYKEWAIMQSLATIWLRKVRGVEGPELGVSDYYQRLADREWERVLPWIDLAGVNVPDRPARVRSVRIRRG